MSEATRDVTVRVSVVGGKVDKFPDFAKMTTAAEGFLQTVESGLKILKSDSETAFAATSKLTDQLREAASMNFGDLGLGEARAAVEEMAAAVEAVNDVGNVDLGGITNSTSGVNDVTSAIEALNEEISQSVTGLEDSWAAAEELAATGEKVEDDLAASLATAAQEADRLAQAELDAKYEVEDATKSAKAATQDEGKTAQEVTFKKIALAERLAAFQRKSTADALKAEKDKADAFKKSADEQRTQMLAAGGAIAGALAAATQFVATIQLIGGDSPEIEELARQFAKVQGIVQGIAAGSQAFNSLNQGLTSLQAASAAATAQLTATGGAATFTQGALIRLAPAAAAAQTALGPLAIAIAGISLAVTAVSAISDYFSDDLPEDVDASTRAFERANDQIDRMKTKLERNAQAIEAQNMLLRAELDLRNAIDGVESVGDINERTSIENQAATSDANQQLQQQRLAMNKEMQDLKKKLADQEAAAIQTFHDTEGADDPASKKRRDQAVADITKTEDQINQLAQADYTAATELNMPLASDNIAEFAAAVEKLPKEQQAAYESVLTDFINKLSASQQAANQDLKSAIQENEMALKDNSRSQDEARKAFEAEQNIALQLQAPGERQKLEQSVNDATATGNLNAGIDAVSGVVSSEREQELRNQLAQGNLTREKLLAEIADAAEFETEKAELEKTIASLNEQAAALQTAREEMTKAQQKVKEEMQRLGEEIRATQQAQQAR